MIFEWSQINETFFYKKFLWDLYVGDLVKVRLIHNIQSGLATSPTWVTAVISKMNARLNTVDVVVLEAAKFGVSPALIENVSQDTIITIDFDCNGFNF